jgi:hypothetical protein
MFKDVNFSSTSGRHPRRAGGTFNRLIRPFIEQEFFSLDSQMNNGIPREFFRVER